MAIAIMINITFFILLFILNFVVPLFIITYELRKVNVKIKFFLIQASEVKNCADASGGAGVVVDLFNLYSPKFFQLAKYFFLTGEKYFANWRNIFW